MSIQRFVTISALCILALAGVTSLGGAAHKPTSLVGTKAPMIASRQWINTDPLEPKDLAGKVVLVEFWTLGSTKCMAAVAAIHELRKVLPRGDVMVVSVHSPESDHEKELQHLQDAIRSLDVDYPVALDDDHAIWNAFHNRQWPTLHVVDRRGIIRSILPGDLRQRTARWDALLDLIQRLRHESP